MAEMIYLARIPINYTFSIATTKNHWYTIQQLIKLTFCFDESKRFLLFWFVQSSDLQANAIFMSIVNKLCSVSRLFETWMQHFRFRLTHQRKIKLYVRKIGYFEYVMGILLFYFFFFLHTFFCCIKIRSIHI